MKTTDNLIHAMLEDLYEEVKRFLVVCPACVGLPADVQDTQECVCSPMRAQVKALMAMHAVRNGA